MQRKATISFTIILLVLGIFISMQFKTQQQLINSIAYQDARDLITLYNTMKAKEEELSLTVQELRQRKNTLEFEAARGEERIYHTQQEIEQLQMLNGEVPVNGPGITVTITRDAPLLHYDLVDIVNELWATGAEAIAINDHRITVDTFIQQYSPDEIFVNNERLLFPCIVKAIGDPHTLEKGLTFTGGLIENWRVLYGIYPLITQRDNIAIPSVKNQGASLE